jgi:hypothetical protein
MYPSTEQIRTAAYQRWQSRGVGHGHDVEDWLNAEQDLLFDLNYQVVASYRLDAPAPEWPRGSGRRQCRFCERSAPRATFTDPIHAIPQFLGNTSLLAECECDECHELFKDSLVDDFEEFTRPFRTGVYNGSRPGGTARRSISIAALKCLARMALSIMPEDEVDFFQDTIEWVVNPDHDLDRRSFRGLGCLLHVAPETSSPWTALARRLDDDAPFPYMLFFIGTANVVFETAVPLCVRDEEYDGEDLIVPRVAALDSACRGGSSTTCSPIPVASAGASRPVESGAV